MRCDLSSFLEVVFVAYNVLFSFFVNEPLNFFQPSFDMVKARPICNIIDDYNAVGSSIIAAGDGFESILSCSVPLNSHKDVLSAI